jgi:hypothetical protein
LGATEYKAIIHEGHSAILVHRRTGYCSDRQFLWILSGGLLYVGTRIKIAKVVCASCWCHTQPVESHNGLLRGDVRTHRNSYPAGAQRECAGKGEGNLKGRELETLAETSLPGYPSYEAITVNGVADIVEHRRMEPLFYMTDDPNVWTELGVAR